MRWKGGGGEKGGCVLVGMVMLMRCDYCGWGGFLMWVVVLIGFRMIVVMIVILGEVMAMVMVVVVVVGVVMLVVVMVFVGIGVGWVFE